MVDSAAAAPERSPAGSARPDLVLVHGLGSASSYWDNIMAALEEDYRVLRVDLPGHGPNAQRLTSAQAHPRRLAVAAIEEVRASGVERPHLVGHSLGGWVTLEMAALGFASSVVALAPAGLWAEGHKPRLEREELVARGSLGLLAPTLPMLLRVPMFKTLTLSLHVANPRGVTNEQFLAAALALMQAKAYSVCDQQAVRNRFESASMIEVPVTVAFGDHDHVLRGPKNQDRTRLPPQTTWHVIEHCGHAMTWDQPAACLELIRSTTAS
jgi:pimeloyl-ACP methyl ester carboxylesterase